MKTHRSRWIIIAAIGILGMLWCGMSAYHSSQGYIIRHELTKQKVEANKKWIGTEKFADNDPRGFGPYKGMSASKLWKNRPAMMYCIPQKDWFAPMGHW